MTQTLRNPFFLLITSFLFVLFPFSESWAVNTDFGMSRADTTGANDFASESSHLFEELRRAEAKAEDAHTEIQEQILRLKNSDDRKKFREQADRFEIMHRYTPNFGLAQGAPLTQWLQARLEREHSYIQDLSALLIDIRFANPPTLLFYPVMPQISFVNRPIPNPERPKGPEEKEEHTAELEEADIRAEGSRRVDAQLQRHLQKLAKRKASQEGVPQDPNTAEQEYQQHLQEQEQALKKQNIGREAIRQERLLALVHHRRDGTTVEDVYAMTEEEQNQWIDGHRPVLRISRPDLYPSLAHPPEETKTVQTMLSANQSESENADPSVTSHPPIDFSVTSIWFSDLVNLSQ